MNVRRATTADAPGIARVHVDSWRSSYKGIVPDAFLSNLSVERRQSNWERDLSSSSQFAFVAEDGPGNVVGFAAGGPSQNPDLPYRGALYAIYLLDDYQGLGLGRALMLSVVHELALRGMNSMMLWVFSDNAQACRFYERMGGRFIEQRQFELGGATLDETGYGWPDTTFLRGSNK